MNVKELIEGYYAGTLSDTEEEQLELLMRAEHPQIPAQERKLYLAVANLPQQKPRLKRSWTLRIASSAAAVALVVGLGFYAYHEQQQQRATEQEILELAMGNLSMALRQSDNSRAKVADIMKNINTDSISHAKPNKTKTKHI